MDADGDVDPADFVRNRRPELRWGSACVARITAQILPNTMAQVMQTPVAATRMATFH